MIRAAAQNMAGLDDFRGKIVEFVFKTLEFSNRFGRKGDKK
jgi:hypothetical protein